MRAGSLVNLPELQFVEKGYPFLEPVALEDVVDRAGPILKMVDNVEVIPNNDDLPGVQKGLQCIQLEHPKGREVARRKVKVGTRERGPRNPGEVFRFKVKY